MNKKAMLFFAIFLAIFSQCNIYAKQSYVYVKTRKAFLSSQNGKKIMNLYVPTRIKVLNVEQTKLFVELVGYVEKSDIKKINKKRCRIRTSSSTMVNKPHYVNQRIGDGVNLLTIEIVFLPNII